MVHAEEFFGCSDVRLTGAPPSLGPWQRSTEKFVRRSETLGPRRCTAGLPARRDRWATERAAASVDDQAAAPVMTHDTGPSSPTKKGPFAPVEVMGGKATSRRCENVMSKVATML
jgi:hypothetical protein